MNEDDLDSDENETNRGEEINDALDELDDMDLSQQTPASEESYKPSQSQPSSSQHSFSQTSGDNEEVCLFYSRWILYGYSFYSGFCRQTIRRGVYQHSQALGFSTSPLVTLQCLPYPWLWVLCGQGDGNLPLAWCLSVCEMCL